jgi:hypothetical protein
VLYGAVPLGLILPPTLLMGMSFPVLQKAVQVDLSGLGRRVGFLQAANIAGSTLGSVLTGLVLLDLIGTAWTLRLLALAGFGFLLAAGRGRARLFAAVGLAAASSPRRRRRSCGRGCTAARPPSSSPRTARACPSSRTSRSRAGTRRTVVYVNGIGQSQLPYGGYHTLLGAFPVLLHPDPKHVVVIGLGSGTRSSERGAGRPRSASSALRSSRPSSRP